MLGAAARERVVGRVKRARVAIARRHEVNRPNVRALVRALARQAEEGRHARAQHRALHRPPLAVVEHGPLLRLDRALDEHPHLVGEVIVRPHDQRRLVDVLERQVIRARRPERAHVAARQHRPGPALPVGRHRHAHFVRPGRRTIVVQLVGHREVAVGGEPARVAEEQVDEGVALAREGPDLRARHEAAVARHVLVDRRLGLAHALGQVVQLAVAHHLQPRRALERKDVLGPQRPDDPRPVEDRHVRRAELVVRQRPRHRLILEGVVEPHDAGVHRDLGARGQVDASAAPQRVQVVERPPVEQIDVVAAVHAAADPERKPRQPHALLFDEEVAQRHRRVELARVVKQRVGDRERRHDARRHRVRVVGGRPVVDAAKLELGVVVFVEARAERHDVGVAARPPAPVERWRRPPVRAELELPRARRRGLDHRMAHRRRRRRCPRGPGRRQRGVGRRRWPRIERVVRQGGARRARHPTRSRPERRGRRWALARRRSVTTRRRRRHLSKGYAARPRQGQDSEPGTCITRQSEHGAQHTHLDGKVCT